MTVRATKITDAGQITIPIELREKYHLKPGDTVLIEDRDGHLTIQHPERAEDWTAGYVGKHAKHRQYYSPEQLRELAEAAIAEQVMDDTGT